jgi:hypothetical protein
MSVTLGNANLSKLGIEALREYPVLHLRCKACKVVWSPNLGHNGRLPAGWHKCPRCKGGNYAS